MNPDDITAELRDIKPAIEIPQEAAMLSPFAIIAMVVAAICICALLVWWWKRRRLRQLNADPVAEALQGLQQLRPMIESANAETYAIAVSDVLRGYVERRFRASAVRQTSEEFLTTLADADLSPIREHRGPLRKFLNQCDLVKFARSELDLEQREALFESARTFIIATAESPSMPAEPPVATCHSFPTTTLSRQSP